MPGGDEWADALSVDTSEDLHVTETSEGVFVFYTETMGEYVRTDRVLSLDKCR